MKEEDKKEEKNKYKAKKRKGNEEKQQDVQESINENATMPDIEEPIKTEKPTIPDHRKGAPWQTGYFRDGQRRVDLVLVMQASAQNLEVLQIEYLMSLIDVGLEIEVENGVMFMHRDLTFVKVHAPDALIQEYGTYFDVRKFFKASHVAYMYEGVHAERELIQLTREQYPGPSMYSTAERSTIVYRLLHVLPFGRNINYFGLHRLLQNNIVLDAYPLHDGPYFLLPEQREDTATPRQALFYSWTGWGALYKGQPKHLIREYFGERLGFVFAFWEALLRVLVLLAMIGAVGAAIGLIASDHSHATVNHAACTNYSYEFAKWYTKRKMVTFSVMTTKSAWCYTYYNSLRMLFGDKIRRLTSNHNITDRFTLVYSSTGYIYVTFPYLPNSVRYHVIWSYREGNYQFYRTFNTWQKRTIYTYYNKQNVTFLPPVEWHWHKEYPVIFYTLKWTLIQTFSGMRTVWEYKTETYTDLPICPKCRDFVACPFRNLTEYCDEVKFKNKLDNPPVVFASLCAAVLGWVFFFMWWNQEDYLTWLWEVPPDACRNTIRRVNKLFRSVERNSIFLPPITLRDLKYALIEEWENIPQHMLRNLVFSMPNRVEVVLRAHGGNIKVQYRFAREATYAFARGFITTLARAALSFAAVGFYLCVVLPLLILFKYKVLRQTVDFDQDWGFMIRTYMVIACLGVVSSGVTALLERPYRWIVYKMADLGNHRTEETYERVIALQWTGLTFLIHFTMFYYFGVIKGSLYTYPSDPARWYMVLGLGMMNCGMLGCFDELFIFGLSSTMARRSFQVVAGIIRRDPVDYTDVKVPCWEREYGLNTLTEDDVMQLILDLVLQYALSTLFMVIFPFAPAFTCVMALWDIRTEAKRVLLSCRRPLLLKTHGLGAWRSVLAMMPLLIGLSNVVMFVLNTNMFDRILHSNQFNDTRFFADYAMGFFNTSDYFSMSDKIPDSAASEFKRYYYKGWQADFCLFPGKWNRLVESYRHHRVFDNSYTATVGKWYINWQQSLFVLVFQAIVALMGAALWRICWSSDGTPGTEQLRVVEAAVRTYQLEVEQVKKNQ